ncbi:hypothetical protein [Rhodobacter sp. CZR27]|uniref:hypothetical protein n=1 Tax=Rhodobacter sp. CZR27 TaxID=2033869 RepID=UPI000BBF2CC4|nr:hypothetical protein [Rhodobacter sp. CZR27]
MIVRWRRRRVALEFAPGEALPFDADLAALARTPLQDAGPPGAGASSHARKRHEIARDMAGQSELALLNALCIAHLRKRHFPDGTVALFRRIWLEQAEALLAELPARWLVSSLITFGDHGATEAERRLGAQMGVLFGLIKLYEAERLFSGLAPDEPFRLGRRAKAPLPLGLPGFSLAKGGLDVNLLAPLWAEAQAVPMAGPIALVLLDRLNADAGTIFRRIARMRERQAAPPKDASGAAIPRANLDPAGKLS